MTQPNPLSQESLPPSRIVRWVLLAGVILFSVGLYFRFGLKVEPIGTAAPATTSTP
ncbi:MAG TPA: hypothetical protein VG454_07660 [Gemmatimonadales bacterium]|nr:hypothetical protein [Gemmatimonadales bacterium]